MTKLVVGLGNPGKEYHETKHNIGFMVLDKWANQENITFNKSKHEALLAEFFIKDEKIILAKPQTFMNASGRSVKPLMDYFKLSIEDLVIIYDDMDIPLGKIRLRQKGSSGGHNGIKSLIHHLETKEFNRMKIGIDRPLAFETVTQHVLTRFLDIDKPAVDIAVQEAVDALIYWTNEQSFIQTMNKFN